METQGGGAGKSPRKRFYAETDFDSHKKSPLLDIPVKDSTELWLIQCPMGSARSELFHGTILVHLDDDERSSRITDSSGKSFELVNSASKEPDAMAFEQFDSDSKIVVKVPYRTCLVRYPESSDFEKPKLHPSYKSGGTSNMRSSSTPSKMGTSKVTFGSSHETLTSVRTMENSAQSSRHKQRRARDSPGSSHQTSKSGKHSTVSSAPGSHFSETSLGSVGHKLKKKRKIDIEQE